jgi:DNA polymerase/3'-5' exonuclease PolX
MQLSVLSALSRLRESLCMDAVETPETYDENRDDVESLDRILSRHVFRTYLETHVYRKNDAISSNRSYMSGITVMFVSHAHTVSSKQIDVWKRNVCVVGAKVTDTPSKDVTHVVMCPNVQGDFKILRNLYRSTTPQFNINNDIVCSKRDDVVKTLRKDWNLSSDVHFVQPGWVIECLKKRKLERVSKYKWASLSSLKRKQQDSRSTQQKEKKAKKRKKTTNIGEIDQEAREKVLKRAPWVRSIRYNIPEQQRLSFMCQKEGSINLNIHITSVLKQMSKVLTQERFRSLAYDRAADVFKSLPVRIETLSQLQSLMKNEEDNGRNTFKRIGKGSMLSHVSEILETGTMKELQGKLKNEFTSTKILFSEIWGVGMKNAELLHDYGMRTIQDIQHVLSRTRRNELSQNEQQVMNMFNRNPRMEIGLRHYEDLKKRIHRKEVTAIYNVVKKMAQKIDSDTIAIVAGSYRRGCESSGDVDVLISHKGVTVPSQKDITFSLYKLIQSLHEIKFLTDDLTGKSEKSYMGICRLSETHISDDDDRSVVSGIYRRIDIKYYPRVQLPFALLYFTGSDHFNRSMRFYAKKCCGLSLSDTRLVEDTKYRDKKNKKVGREVPCESEEEIFAALGLVYRDPTQRNCYGVQAGENI